MHACEYGEEVAVPGRAEWNARIAKKPGECGAQTAPNQHDSDSRWRPLVVNRAHECGGGGVKVKIVPCFRCKSPVEFSPPLHNENKQKKKTRPKDHHHR